MSEIPHETFHTRQFYYSNIIVYVCSIDIYHWTQKEATGLNKLSSITFIGVAFEMVKG